MALTPATKSLLRLVLDHFENRKSELATSCMMLGLGLHLAVWPAAIGASAFREILDVLPPAWLCFGFLIAGAARLAALIANGAWPHYGPMMRAAGALSGAFIWSQMCISLYRLVPAIGAPPSPGIPVYFVLSMLELACMYQALVQVDWDRGRKVKHETGG